MIIAQLCSDRFGTEAKFPSSYSRMVSSALGLINFWKVVLSPSPCLSSDFPQYFQHVSLVVRGWDGALLIIKQWEIAPSHFTTFPIPAITQHAD